MFSSDSKTEPGDQLQQALDLGSEVVERYGLSSLRLLLASCRSAFAQQNITVAIVGRFKAGKSSFINDFIGRSILPVGVIPVTTVITEIRFGPTEKAEVHFLDGQKKELPLDEIGSYVSERENQENRKRVAAIKVELPSLAQFRGLTFVDTPGLGERARPRYGCFDALAAQCRPGAGCCKRGPAALATRY